MKAGSRVWHVRFGAGTVESFSGLNPQIAFDSGRVAVIAHDSEHLTLAADLSPSALDKLALLERLKAWRLQAANRSRKSAFIIAHDSTLKAIAEARPHTREELAKMPGMGAQRLSMYGDEILAVLQQSGEADRSAER